MPLRFIIAAVIIAALLGGLLVWLGRPAAPVAPPVPLLGIPVADIRSVDIRWSQDGTIACSITRAADGTWVMHWQAGGAMGSWPAIASRVAGAMNLLGKVQGVPSAAAETLGDPVWITVKSGGKEVKLKAAKRSFGGIGVVERPGEGTAALLAGEVDAQLVQVFGRQDVLAWRDLSVFPADVTQVSRVEISATNGDGENTLLQRVGSRWAIQEPHQARADRSQVEGWLAALKKLRIGKFPTEQPGYTPLTDEQFTQWIVIKTDRNTPDGDAASRSVLVQEFFLGPFAGDQALIAKAQVSILRPNDPSRSAPEILWGPTMIVVDQATATDVLRPPAAFASRIASRAVAADVRRIELGNTGRPLDATRKLDQWFIGGSQVPLVQRDALRSIIDLLTSTNALRVEFESDLNKPESWTSVTLSGAEGPPLDAVIVFPQTNGQQRELVVQSGSTLFVFSADAAAAWEESLKHLDLR